MRSQFTNKLLWPTLFGLLLLGAACQKTTTVSNTATSTFSGGIYYRLPNINDPSAVLTHLDGALSESIIMSPVDYDIQPSQAVYPDDDKLFIVNADGSKRTVKAEGIYQMARPTLSPDGTRIAVQATKTKHSEGQAADPSELKIFVVSLDDGSVQQISAENGLPNESPTWFNQSNKIAYSTFSPVEGVDIHIFDLDQNREVLTIQNSGWHGLAVSKDDTQLFVPNSMRIYSTVSGELVADLKAKAISDINQAGFPLAENVGDSHSPFLDGDWSPDGTQLVFDAVVVEHSEPHNVLFTMDAYGNNVKAVTNQIEVNPNFSNNYNFSQVNPIWL